MSEPYELRFAGLRAGGTIAYYLTTDAITGGPKVVEFLASRESTQRRFKNRVEQNLPVEEDRKALVAFSDAYGEVELLLYPFSQDKFGGERE